MFISINIIIMNLCSIFLKRVAWHAHGWPTKGYHGDALPASGVWQPWGRLPEKSKCKVEVGAMRARVDES